VIYSNSKQITLDYEVKKAGPSGIGKVDLWVTRDEGRSWNYFAEDQDRQPPMTIEVGQDGLYGFALVVQSGAGRGKSPPKSGDAPEIRVMVDTTPPSAQLYAPESDPMKKDSLILSWTASDQNPAPNPITLEWAPEKKEGAWQVIQENLPNSGKYVWKLPENIPYRVYLRLKVKDLAQNVGIAETPEPVCIDLQEPQGHLLGLAGSIRKQ
jgi:hypothetical protein